MDTVQIGHRFAPAVRTGRRALLCVLVALAALTPAARCRGRGDRAAERRDGRRARQRHQQRLQAAATAATSRFWYIRGRGFRPPLALDSGVAMQRVLVAVSLVAVAVPLSACASGFKGAPATYVTDVSATLNGVVAVSYTHLTLPTIYSV